MTTDQDRPTVDSVRQVLRRIPRSTEVMVHGRVKFRVKQIVYVAFSKDEETMGFAFPKEHRDGLIATEPEKFLLPRPSDLRFNWVEARLAALDHEELRELVLESWSMVVPQSVAGAYFESLPGLPG